MASRIRKRCCTSFRPSIPLSPSSWIRFAADSTRIFDTVVAALLDSDRSEFDEAYLADTYLQMALPAARGVQKGCW